jgi:hypothetical protein
MSDRWLRTVLATAAVMVGATATPTHAGVDLAPGPQIGMPGGASVTPAGRWLGDSLHAAPEPGPTISYGAGGLQPVVPERLLDTRTGVGAAAVRVGPDGVVELQVAGRGGVPEAGAGAVVLNVTAVAATERSFVTVWPTGAPRPTASNLNVAPGDTVPNLVVVKVGAGGMVSLFNRFGELDLLADVAGWFPEGSGLEPLVPERILDTRSGVGAPLQRVGPDGLVELQVTGQGGVPSVGVGAVVMNVTAVAPTSHSFVTAWPTGAPRPTASNLNLTPGDTVPNLVIVKVGEGGRVSLFNRFGDVDLLADVAGWFPERGGFESLVPERILDTREGLGAPLGRVGADGTIDLQVAGRGGVPDAGVGAVVMNVTAVGPSAGSFVTVWPTGIARPVASNLNVVAGDTAPNLVIVKLGDGGRVSLFNRFGDVDLVADVAGWFPDGFGASTTLVPAASTTLGGPGDVVSVVGSSDTGATVVLAASADVPAVDGHLAVFPHAAVPGGVSGRVVAVTANADATTTVTLVPSGVQDMFTDLDAHGGFGVDLDAFADTNTAGLITQASLGSWDCGGSVSVSSLPTFTLGGLDATFDYDLSERYARVLLTMEPSVAWQLSESIAFSCKLQLWEDKTLGWIGPFEVSGGGAALSVSVSAGAKSADLGGSMPIKLGFEHKDGETTDLSGVDVVASGNSTASASASASVGLSFSTKGKAFGIAGVSLSVGPKLTASLSAETCITLKLSAALSLSGEIGKWMLTWKVDLGSFTIDLGEIYRSGCGDPQFRIIDGSIRYHGSAWSEPCPCSYDGGWEYSSQRTDQSEDIVLKVHEPGEIAYDDVANAVLDITSWAHAYQYSATASGPCGATSESTTDSDLQHDGGTTPSIYSLALQLEQGTTATEVQVSLVPNIGTEPRFMWEYPRGLRWGDSSRYSTVLASSVSSYAACPDSTYSARIGINDRLPFTFYPTSLFSGVTETAVDAPTQYTGPVCTGTTCVLRATGSTTVSTSGTGAGSEMVIDWWADIEITGG